MSTEEREVDGVVGGDVAPRNSGKRWRVAFLMERPGCVACRKRAMAHISTVCGEKNSMDGTGEDHGQDAVMVVQ